MGHWKRKKATFYSDSDPYLRCSLLTNIFIKCSGASLTNPNYNQTDSHAVYKLLHMNFKPNSNTIQAITSPQYFSESTEIQV